jgi:hypothetical protein
LASYISVRLEKYKGGAIRGMQIHDQRQRPGRSRTNPDIDWDRTGLNVDLLHGGEDVDFRRAVDARIAGLGLSRRRSDAVEMVGALVTVSPEWARGRSEEEIRALYGDALGFLSARYGGPDGANMVSAVIHMDERTPHLHVNFVPVTDDGRLSAKDVVGGRQQLRELQDGIAREVGRPRGLSRGVEGSRARHVPIPELKRLNRELERVNGELERRSAALGAINGEIDAARARIDGLRREGRDLGTELAGLRSAVSSAREALPEAVELGRMNPSPAPLTGHVRGVSVDQVRGLRDAARERLALAGDVKRLETENARLRESLAGLSRARDVDAGGLSEARERLDEIERAKVRDPELGAALEREIERDREGRSRDGGERERE